MTDKEVRRLSRSQLLALLAELSGENETLHAETERMREELEALRVTNEKLEALGDISRQILASVSVSDVPPARQEAPAERDPSAGSEENAPPAPAGEPALEKADAAAKKPDTRLSILCQRARAAFGDRR